VIYHAVPGTAIGSGAQLPHPARHQTFGGRRPRTGRGGGL